MNLQGRTLSINMEGKDVHLLQSKLGQLGYQISTDERNNDFPEKSIFGKIASVVYVDAFLQETNTI